MGGIEGWVGDERRSMEVLVFSDGRWLLMS